ncbi:MAG TPA: ROK family protein [Actinospica sp.]|nr:ROK family protein [Actinospica sp.]
MDDRLVAALDIGGTKIAGGLVDAGGRTVLIAATRPTPAGSDAAAVADAVGAVLGELAAAPAWPAVVAVGIGSAGPVDLPHGAVSPVNIPAWRDFPLVRLVAGHPAVAAAGLPVTLAGDAVAMAAGEHLHGAARNTENALCMVVSTGVGGGLILGGRVLAGATGNAGHIGHISVDMNGEPCPCGSRGCVERMASGPAIARYALALGWRPSGADASAEAVAAAARGGGDPAALAAFARAAQALAAGIAATAALVEIDTVVIGGGVAEAGDVLFDPLRGWLARYATLAFTRGIRVLPAQQGRHAGLVGAAACAITALQPA